MTFCLPTGCLHVSLMANEPPDTKPNIALIIELQSCWWLGFVTVGQSQTVVSYLLFKQGQYLLFCYIFGNEKGEKRTFPLHSVSHTQLFVMF